MHTYIHTYVDKQHVLRENWILLVGVIINTLYQSPFCEMFYQPSTETGQNQENNILNSSWDACKYGCEGLKQK